MAPGNGRTSETQPTVIGYAMAVSSETRTPGTEQGCKIATSDDAILIDVRARIVNAIDGVDLGVALGAWGTNGGPVDADVTNDGIVDGADHALVLSGWGSCP